MSNRKASIRLATRSGVSPAARETASSRIKRMTAFSTGTPAINHTLFGGAPAISTQGDDSLIGGPGSNLLFGGARNDPLRHPSPSGSTLILRNTIKNFVSGHDKIDLSCIDAKATVSGNQGFCFLAAAPIFTTAGDAWTEVSGELFRFASMSTGTQQRTFESTPSASDSMWATSSSSWRAPRVFHVKHRRALIPENRARRGSFRPHARRSSASASSCSRK